MADKTLPVLKAGIVEKFKKENPREKPSGSVFENYLLNAYAVLLLKIYKKAEKGKK